MEKRKELFKLTAANTNKQAKQTNKQKTGSMMNLPKYIAILHNFNKLKQNLGGGKMGEKVKGKRVNSIVLFVK